MKTSNLIFILAAVSLSTGCCVFERKPLDYKAGAIQAPSLEVPPDLIKPATEQRFAIPAADGTQVAKYSDYSRAKPDEQATVVPAKSAVLPTANETTAKLLEVGGVRFVLINEPFDRVWRKAGQALERAGIAVADVDRSKGIFFLRNKDPKSADLQVFVHESNGSTDVTVKEGNDPKGKEAVRILDVLFQNLEK